ncbi:transient receptor potential channel pyrexia isoform X2 [Hydra vulgaris]|uniref:Transient receptor potential channel pyrexia isoform X2 n=1 Tax=Hydra vulgaris TaxID=6087 RepID=A0ABM4CQ87_HYDVU
MKLKTGKIIPIDQNSQYTLNPLNKDLILKQDNLMHAMPQNIINETAILLKDDNTSRNSSLDFIAKKRSSISSSIQSNLKKHVLYSEKQRLFSLGECGGGLCLENIENSNGITKRSSLKSKQLLNYFSKMSFDCNNQEIDLKIIESFVTNGADINITDKYGQTILHEASRIWHPDVAKFILLLKADINHADKYGRTPLHVASAVDYPEMVKFLIEYGANKEALTFGEMQTPVHYAAKNDAVESLRLLIKFGCQIEILDSKHRTPLHVAAELDRSETAKFLVKVGANVSAYDSSGLSTLYLMIEKMPHVAQKALNQYHQTDRANRKQYFYLNLLEADQAGTFSKIAKSPLEAVTLNNQMHLLLHIVFHRLIQVKWMKFGNRKHLQHLLIQILFVALWSIFAFTHPYNSKSEYSNSFKFIWWRVLLEVSTILLTVIFITQEIYEWHCSVREHNKWKNWRINEVQRDLDFCHPQWPEERSYIILEIERIKKSKVLYFKDLWNLLDWIAYLWILLGVCFRIAALSGNQDAAKYHKKILAFSMTVIWLRLLKVVKVYQFLGPFIVMLGHIMKDTIKFCFLFMEFFFPFVIAFWLMFGGEENALKMIENNESSSGWENLDDVIYSVWLITLSGDFDYKAVASVDKFMARTLIIMYTACSSILLLNLFVALMSDTFQRVYDNAQANQLMQKAIALNAYQRSLSDKCLNEFIGYLCSNCSPEETYYDDDTEEGGELEKMTIQIKDVVDEIKSQLDEETSNKTSVSKSKQYSQLVSLLMEQQSSISELTNKVNNLTRVLERWVDHQSGNERLKDQERKTLKTLPSIYELKPNLFPLKDN